MGVIEKPLVCWVSLFGLASLFVVDSDLVRFVALGDAAPKRCAFI